MNQACNLWPAVSISTCCAGEAAAADALLLYVLCGGAKRCYHTLAYHPAISPRIADKLKRGIVDNSCPKPPSPPPPAVIPGQNCGSDVSPSNFYGW